jgi:hypothetical protein
VYTNMYTNIYTNAAQYYPVQAIVQTRVLKEQFIIIQVGLKDDDSSVVNIYRVGSGVPITR